MADTLSGAGLTDGTVTEAKIASAFSTKVTNAYNQANNAYNQANNTITTAGATMVGDFIIGNGAKLGVNISPNTALHVNGTMTILSTIESPNVVSAALTANVNFDVLTQSILYLTQASSANATINFRGNSTSTFANFLKIGQSFTATLLVTNGTTGYVANTVQVDSAIQTVYWAGGSTPTNGNPNAIDLYSFTIIRTDGVNYTVLASQQKYA